MSQEYKWDTKEVQESNRPYGFIDFPENFLEIYLNKRQVQINFFEKKSRPMNYENLNFKMYSQNDFKNKERFNTERAIRTIHTIVTNEGNLEGKTLEHYRRIIKKAELRKLTTEYNSNFINTTKDKLGFKGYGYLASTLAKYAENDIQSLSTLLKVNDYLISQKEEMSSALEFRLVYSSLLAERQLVEKIAEKKGVK